MKETTTDRQKKICCATFYQSDLARVLLGEIFHPGGMELTGQLGQAVQLQSGDRVLDIACGRGHSAVYLAKTYGCHVIGLDYGAGNIEAAKAHADSQQLNLLVDFSQGDAEATPFEDCTFDALITECSFCTFQDKNSAAAEMVRLLRPGGRLGLTDMTVAGPLPQDIDNLLSWVACIAGAGTDQDYIERLESAGLTDFFVGNQSQALLDLVTNIRRKLLGLEFVRGLSKQNFGVPSSNMEILDDLDLTEGKRLARWAEEFITSGDIGYTLITARKR